MIQLGGIGLLPPSHPDFHRQSPGSSRAFTRDAQKEDYAAYDPHNSVALHLDRNPVRKELTAISESGDTSWYNPEDQPQKNQMAWYEEIVRKATILEDVSADCWGALFFIVVVDIPAWRAGNISKVGQFRLTFSIVVFALNLFIQAMLLFFICKLLMKPGLLSAQDVYKLFTDKAFSGGEVDNMLFDKWDKLDKDDICGLALSQTVFARVILFLWVTTNVGELKSNFTKCSETWNLPHLPEELDSSLMIRGRAEADEGVLVVCLNHGSKIMLLSLIFIPKFIIAVLLTCTGCLWLMAAENIADLILNSLALAFVVQVDELIAMVFFPSFYIQDLLELAIASQDPEHGAEVLETRQLWSLFYSGLTLVFTMLTVEMGLRFQPVIPGYNGGNVQRACAAYVKEQVPWCMPGHNDCFPES